MIENICLLLVIVPLLGAALCIPLSEKLSRQIALLTTLIGVFLAAVLYGSFDPARSTTLQFPWVVSWISGFNIRFALGVDGISLPLVLLTKFMMPIAILASWAEERKRRAFMTCFLVLDSAMTGTFLATDIFLFYVFWELMLLPMILLIGVWGSTERIYASLKFFLFTFAGSILMLGSILWLFLNHYQQTGVYTADLGSLRLAFAAREILWGLNAEQIVFLGFAAAFLIKIPVFPFHTWLPDAHVQAPTGGSVLLAAVLLKMGTYGLLRFAIPLTPNAFMWAIPGLATLALIGIVYGAWVAFQQTDIKKLVAYSSVSHLGFVVLGLCAMNDEGLSGAVLQNVNHGLSSGALFLLVGMLYERRHSRKFEDYGGIAEVMPWYAIVLVFVACSSMGVPGLNGFVGEFLILAGSFRADPTWTLIAVTGIVFGAIYLLVMLRKILFGGNISAENKLLKDLSVRDWCAVVPLCALILILGIFPNVLLSKVDFSLQSYWKSINTVPQSSPVTKHLPSSKVGVSEAKI